MSKVNCSRFRLAVCAALPIALLTVSCELWSSKPNVVLIIVDTLRADRLGSYGFETNSSPELDRLAESGVRFESVIAQSSWTRPSIGSMLTSQYPRTIGIYKEDTQILPDRFETLAEALKAHGYLTIGLTANPNLNVLFNFQQGFDHYVNSTVVWNPERHAPFQGKANQYDYGGHQRFPSAVRMFEDVRRILDSEAQGPYYVQLNLMEVHEYRFPVERDYDRLPADQIEHLKKPERRYVLAINYVSKVIGQFVAELQSRPEWEDTLFVIVSDHGEGLFDHLLCPGMGNIKKREFRSIFR